VSVAGFAPWVCAGRWFHQQVGEVGLYAGCLVAFLVAALVLLPGLLNGPRRISRCARFSMPPWLLDTSPVAKPCICWR